MTTKEQLEAHNITLAHIVAAQASLNNTLAVANETLSRVSNTIEAHDRQIDEILVATQRNTEQIAELRAQW